MMMLRRAAASVLMTVAATASAAPLQLGDELRTHINKSSVRLRHIEVQRVTSDNTIDFVAVTTTPVPLPNSSDEMMIQLAELCLRYQGDLIAAFVPTEEHAKINLFVPLYQLSNGEQVGFAFQVRDEACTLEAPFSPVLAKEARRHADEKLD
jgi:hypothetical protein